MLGSKEFITFGEEMKGCEEPIEETLSPKEELEELKKVCKLIRDKGLDTLMVDILSEIKGEVISVEEYNEITKNSQYLARYKESEWELIKKYLIED